PEHAARHRARAHPRWRMICAEAYVHPGVTVGVDAVVGVRSVVLKDVESANVVSGHPAVFIRMRNVGDAPV
ncbi:MAG: hypothetical protein ACO3ZG_10345, partial [Kiritimatiellia bacterium]